MLRQSNALVVNGMSLSLVSSNMHPKSGTKIDVLQVLVQRVSLQRTA